MDCWWCKRRADSSAAVEKTFYRKVRGNFAVLPGVVLLKGTTYETQSVVIPRCLACKAAQTTTVTGQVENFVVGILVLGLIGAPLLAAWFTQYHLRLVWLSITAAIVAFAVVFLFLFLVLRQIRRAARPSQQLVELDRLIKEGKAWEDELEGITRTSDYSYYKKYPSVDALLKQGWTDRKPTGYVVSS